MLQESSKTVKLFAEVPEQAPVVKTVIVELSAPSGIVTNNSLLLTIVKLALTPSILTDAVFSKSLPTKVT